VSAVSGSTTERPVLCELCGRIVEVLVLVIPRMFSWHGSVVVGVMNDDRARSLFGFEYSGVPRHVSVAFVVRAGVFRFALCSA